jgi:hypothetical protein
MSQTECIKAGIDESAIVQGKISEDSQATRNYLNNLNLTRHRSCNIAKITKIAQIAKIAQIIQITQITKVLMSNRNLNF